ncbi:MAG: helix-turn-helix transcriptional regulator [Chloroflexota bacterium]|nr:helix-turn-helix transcriptional regulator [Chloroflexota bacterium]
MSLSTPVHPPIGQLLRGWRERRGLTQLELALRAEVSTRHLSFVETGRASPSREMILHLADQLDVPLRERNQLLLAAGYAPIFSEASLDSPHMAAVRAAVRKILLAHEPSPAVVVDRHWNVLDANSGLSIFTECIPAELLKPPINVMRLSLHPQGAAPSIINLRQWRAHLLGRLRREIARTADAALVRLYDEVRGYGGAASAAQLEIPGPGEVVAPLRFRGRDQELVFFSTVAAFGTPLDVTVAELAIELFFPADSATAEALRRRGADRG